MKKILTFFSIMFITVSLFSQRGQNTVQVNVNTDPSGAYFTIGQSKYGPTPITIPLIINQIYEITFTMPGYQTKTIKYKAGTGNIKELLFPLTYTLNINANVTGADVYINGQLYGKTPLNLTLNGGNYTILVKMEGYKNWSTSINLNNNQNISANLEMLRFIILSLPVGTQLWLNGKPYKLNWGNIEDKGFIDFKISAETNNKFETIELKYKNISSGPLNVEFNNKKKELRLILIDN